MKIKCLPRLEPNQEDLEVPSWVLVRCTVSSSLYKYYMFAVGALVSRGVGDASSASTPAAVTAGESGEKPKPSGMPAKLLSKVVETEGSDGSFAVYNLTFQVPNGASDLGVRIGYMDSIKVMVPVRPWRAAIACLNGCTHGVFEIIFPHLLRICPFKITHPRAHTRTPSKSPTLNVHTHALHQCRCEDRNRIQCLQSG